MRRLYDIEYPESIEGISFLDIKRTHLQAVTSDRDAMHSR